MTRRTRHATDSGARWSSLALGLVAVLAIALVTAAALFVPGAITAFDAQAVREYTQGANLSPEELLAATESARANRQALLWLAGGVVAVITLIFTWHRDRDNRAKLQLERDANFTSRYTEAVSQLGSEQIAIRIGGVYALERIAQDSGRDHDVILQVLAAYVRMDGRQRNREEEERPEDVTAAIQAIRHLAPDRKIILDLARADLSGARLGQTKLGDVILTETHMPHVQLHGANLSRAVLEEATLNGALLMGANLTGARMTGTNLRDAMLTKANLTDADLADADLRGAILARAVLLGTNLSGARLDDAYLVGVLWDAHTQWPDSFDTSSLPDDAAFVSPLRAR